MPSRLPDVHQLDEALWSDAVMAAGFQHRRLTTCLPAPASRAVPEAKMKKELQERSAPPLVTPELLDRMVRAIVDEVDPEKVILFGSRGRGDAGADSDVDLLVIEAEPFGPDRNKHQEMRRLDRAVRGFRVPKDILVFSNEEVEYWHDSLNHVLARALREGRILYERRAAGGEPLGRDS